MNYEWDEPKRAKNVFTHGVDFMTIYDFDWATALVVADVRFEKENRYAALGMVDRRLYFVAYTESYQ